MNKAAIKDTIKRLQNEHRQEMITQNNKNSLERSYHKADEISRQIQNYQDMITPNNTGIKFDPNWQDIFRR